jgi:thiamine-phosphate pyrophosphorylase
VTPLRRQRIDRLRGLYAIADGAGPRPPFESIAAFLRGGARVVQLRLKSVGAGELLRVAREASALCRAHGALFLVNDRPDVARLAAADGVHLGQEDLPVEAARAVLGPDALIGVSTHSDAEIDAALADGADYLGFGPVFATASKPGAPLPPPHGIAGLARAVKRAAPVPVVAIGGLGTDNAAAVASAGSRCLAVIGELSRAEDPEIAARQLALAFGAGGTSG